VYANLVGACVSSSAEIPLLANGFGDLSFWTYREGINRVEVEPYYDEASRSQKRLFRSFFEFGSCSGGVQKTNPWKTAAPA